MTTTDHAAAQAQQLIQFIRDEIPLARAMDLQLAHCDDDMLSLSAPLAPNVNDKGCAFGGSLVSLMTLSGWALVELALRRRGIDCDDDMLSLSAPLAPNVNDKGCAFGGSLVSLMTLSGWALVELALRRRGIDCDVFVAESSVRYLAPLWGDFRSDARLPPDADWATFFSTLAARNKARISVDCVVHGDDGKPASTLTARYVAKRRG